jgi:hypothetical protein
MNVSCLVSLQRSWERTRRLLFLPFRLETWLVLGFAAFLSEWLSGGWGGSGVRSTFHRHHVAEVGPRLRHLFLDTLWGPLLIALLVVAILAWIVFQWLGARGKFVFLDGVVRERAGIAEPWRRYARQANSLFLWRLGFYLVAGLLVGGVLLTTAGAAVLGWLGFRSPVALAPPILGGIALLVLLALLGAFVMLLLDAFVVPLMYRHQLSANQAWGRFLPLFRQNLGGFLRFALFCLAIAIVLVVAVTAVGFATCCVGFVLIALPYVGQVVLLPVYVVLRAFGPEFLAQFGPEFDVLTRPAAEVLPPAPPAAPQAGAPA